MIKKILFPGFVSGVIILIVGMIGLSRIYNVVFPSLSYEYEHGIFRPWTDPAMWLFYLYPFILGLGLAWGWDKTKSLIKNKSLCQRGLTFALSYWLIASLPGMFMSFTSFQVSFLMVFSWGLSGLIQTIIVGWVLAKMNP